VRLNLAWEPDVVFKAIADLQPQADNGRDMKMPLTGKSWASKKESFLEQKDFEKFWKEPAAEVPGLLKSFGALLRYTFRDAETAFAAFDPAKKGSLGSPDFLASAVRLHFAWKAEEIFALTNASKTAMGKAEWMKVWQLREPAAYMLVRGFSKLLRGSFESVDALGEQVVGGLNLPAFESFAKRVHFDGEAWEVFRELADWTGVVTEGRFRSLWDLADSTEHLKPSKPLPRAPPPQAEDEAGQQQQQRKWLGR